LGVCRIHRVSDGLQIQGRNQRFDDRNFTASVTAVLCHRHHNALRVTEDRDQIDKLLMGVTRSRDTAIESFAINGKPTGLIPFNIAGLFY